MRERRCFLVQCGGWVNGKRHREEGPAVLYGNGSKAWWIDGKRHREDGPAIEKPGGYREWYLDGERISEDEFNQRMAEKNRPCVGKTVVVDGVEYTLS